MLSAATGVAPASCRHVSGAQTAGQTSTVKPARRRRYLPASDRRGKENGAQPLSLRRAPLLKFSTDLPLITVRHEGPARSRRR
jgi:hypothetical protein